MFRFSSLILLFTACACLSAASKRIISLGPVITDELFSIGAGDEIVGVTTYCIHPEAAKKKEKIGDTLTMNTEKIVSLKPDVIIATGLTHPTRVQKLRELGFNVVHFPQAATFNAMCEQLLELGTISGHSAEAKRVVAASKKRVNDIYAQTKLRAQRGVFLEIGIAPLFAVTTNSYINDIIRYAGGSNIASHFGIGMINREAVIALNPDVIIIATMGVAGDDEIRQWKKHTTLTAVKKNAVYCIEPYGICSTTVASFPSVTASLAALINNGAK
ncbi:MAG: ABC transporter substrate-binding protein [Spirochaetes bacterium]|nr:ABC transporter substrate-binding protein [Spirochaetota bacterium]